MLVIPLEAAPAQTFNVVLNSQNCTISVYQKTTGLYLDLSVNNTLVIAGVLCLDRNRIVRDAYLGFSGDLAFYDMQGTSDPTSSDIGTRYVLVYLSPTDLAGFGLTA